MFPIAQVLWHEATTFTRPSRKTEPHELMDNLAQVKSYAQAYAWGGAMSVVQLHHISEVSLMIRPGDTILDLACGPGPLLLELAAIYPECKFIGADLSPLMLQHLEQEARTRELKNISVVRDDIRSLLSLQERTVNLVITTIALHHLRIHVDGRDDEPQSLVRALGRDDRRVHVAGVVGHEDDGALQPGELLPTGRPAGRVDVHHRAQDEAAAIEIEALERKLIVDDGDDDVAASRCAALLDDHEIAVENSGILCLQGVLTDDRLQTNIAGVYAAGDCAEAFDAVTGKTIVSAIQPNAADQAYCAGMNMAGKQTQLRGVTQINVLDTLGLISTSFGQWQGVPGGQHAELTDEANFRYVRLEFDDDVLVGSNAIGHIEHVGLVRGLIQSRVKLGPWKDRLLRDPLLLPEAYLASVQAQQAWGLRAA